VCSSAQNVLACLDYAVGLITMSPLDEHLQRVREAYGDRPSLSLTPSQAQRMFGLEPPMCVAVLEALLNEAFLVRTREGLFVRQAIRNEPTDLRAI